MKRLVPEYSFSAEQLHTISVLADETGLTEQIVRILYARGVDTAQKISKFMHPSKKNFLNPFLMRGMKEAVEVITAARDEGKTVAVFGDYDADGVCASAIMYHVLREFGIDAHIYVPERADGYGLSIEVIDRIFEECNPEVFITVDCGISCAEEAQYIYELGSDVIITDHHELPEVIPDCIVINPKLEDDYPYDNLCGAGVAFKLGCALIGEAAYKYLDFATLATVADSVPLLGENRDIVTEGLKLFNTKLRSCFLHLLGKIPEGGIMAQTLAFNVAPRVNAAGRMGDAQSAFRLFISEKETEIYELATKLCFYNTERQKCCDELYLSAKQKLLEKGAYGNVIMLSDESWNTGFIGIVAARIAEEYNRPTLLFVHNGDLLKGSARSIENINIFTALRNCSQYIEEFGGHAQAAGINITPDNFDVLEAALNEEIGNTYTAEDFEQLIPICEEITSQFPEKFARELMMMEPYGVGHKRPYFSVCAEACTTRAVKAMSPHLSVRCQYIDLMYFSGAKNVKIIESDVRKHFVFDVSISRYKGRDYVKGYVRELVYDGKTGRNVGENIFSNAVARFYAPHTKVHAKFLSTAEIKASIREKQEACPYGLCLIASDRRTLAEYDLQGFGCDLFYPSSRNLANALIVSPAADADLSGFRDIIFLDTPTDFNIAALEGRQVCVNREIDGYKMFKRLDTTRESLLEIFAALRREIHSLIGNTAEELAAECDGLGFDKWQFIFAVNVFEELGLVAFGEGRLMVYRGVKAELTDSAIYRKVCFLQEE